MATRKAQEKPQDQVPVVDEAPAETVETVEEVTVEVESDEPVESIEVQVRAHMADPQGAALPSGVVINFGDPEPIRQSGG